MSMIDKVEVLKMLNKAGAYKRLFMKDGVLSEDAKIVMKDLAKFCRANTSITMVSPTTRMIDPLASMQAEGRREVFLRVAQNLSFDEATFLKFYEEQNDE